MAHTKRAEHGRAIRALREAAGLTAADVAREAMVSESYLSKVETGQDTATPRWIGKVTGVIARHLSNAA